MSFSDFSFNDTVVKNVTEEKILVIVTDNKLKISFKNYMQ